MINRNINDYTERTSTQNVSSDNIPNWENSTQKAEADKKLYEARKKLEDLLEERRLDSELHEYDNFDLGD